MLNLIIGFLLGVTVSWFWLSQLKDSSQYQAVLQKELAVNGQLGSITVLKKRLEALENRLAEIDRPAEAEVVQAGEDRKELTLPLAEGSAFLPPSPTGPAKVKSLKQRRNINQVQSLWQEGRALPEIAALTNLAKGEIELIISLQEKRSVERRVK